MSSQISLPSFLVFLFLVCQVEALPTLADGERVGATEPVLPTASKAWSPILFCSIVVLAAEWQQIR
jgi:hypothetical protein